jgi:hypothetical protein
MDITGIFTAIMGIFTDFMVRFLFFLLVFQSLGFFWFIYVVIRFGLLRRDEPDQETMEILQDPELMQAIRAAHRGSNIVSLEDARRALDLE